MSSPPARSSRSYTVTVWPRRLSASAAASPAGPEPITATFFPVRTEGVRGWISPFPKAYSMMASSFSRMVTGSPCSAQVQAASQGAGHTRPVNSGKLLVLMSRESA